MFEIFFLFRSLFPSHSIHFIPLYTLDKCTYFVSLKLDLAVFFQILKYYLYDRISMGNVYAVVIKFIREVYDLICVYSV